MLVTFNKAEIFENENGKFLTLEVQALISGTKVIIQNTFPATSNFFIEDLPKLELNAVVPRNIKH